MSATRDNSGTLGVNRRKEKDTHPSHSGQCTIDGKAFWISAWVKEGPSGKFFSLAFKEKDAAPKPATQKFDDFEDQEIPFNDVELITTLKTCFKCEQAKSRKDFYKHSQMGDGLLGKCKECCRKDVVDNRNKRIDQYREYDRKRGWRPGDTAKIRARAAVRILERKPCEVCGEIRVDAHHEDYSKPLEVRWVCRKHHMQMFHTH